MTEKHFEMFYERVPATGPACVEYALIPEGKRRTLALEPGVPMGCRRDAVTGEIVLVNFFHIFNDGLGHGSQWQVPPGPAGKPIVAATLRVKGDSAYAAVRYESGECSEWFERRLDNSLPCPTPPEGGEPCQGKPCVWTDRPQPPKA